MGLINQFRQFSQAVTKGSYLLKPLLSTRNQYMWLPEHQKAFEELKLELAKPTCLGHFEPKLETRLETDASRKKTFGYALVQKHDTEWKIVAGSCWIKIFKRRGNKICNGGARSYSNTVCSKEMPPIFSWTNTF